MAPVDVIREVLAAAAATVALPFRAATVLRDGRAIVVRAEAFADGRPVSTIIKRFKVGYHEHFLRERAGLRLLSNLGGGLVPALLGENEGELTLVLQDVNNGLSLDTIIASSDTATARSQDSARICPQPSTDRRRTGPSPCRFRPDHPLPARAGIEYRSTSKARTTAPSL